MGSPCSESSVSIESMRLREEGRPRAVWGPCALSCEGLLPVAGDHSVLPACSVGCCQVTRTTHMGALETGKSGVPPFWKWTVSSTLHF